MRGRERRELKGKKLRNLNMLVGALSIHPVNEVLKFYQVTTTICNFQVLLMCAGI